METCTLSSWHDSEDSNNTCVRFHDFGTYGFAIQLTLDLISIESDDVVRVFADSATTSDKRNAIKKQFPNAAFTEIPRTPLDSQAVSVLDELDQVFILTSNQRSVAVVWLGGDDESEGASSKIDGFWTTDSGAIQRLLNNLFAGDPPGEIPDGNDPSLATRLMNGITRHYEVQQRDALKAQSDLSVILEILKSLSVRRRTHDILYLFVEQIAHYINTDRCSVVRVWEGDSKAHVLASHEDETVEDMIIQLEKYPEIVQTLKTSLQTVVNDVRDDSLTKDYAPELEKAGISAIMVMPIVLYNQNVGSFLLRSVRKDGPFSKREVEFCQIVAESAANAIERADLFDTIQKANRRLEYLATTDSLTGLYNRRYFRSRLEEEYSRSKRYGSPLSCMLIDIDNFKSVNDTFGHLVGDEVLCEIANRTLKAIRTNDVVARYGGEEFVVILPQTDSLGASKYAQRLIEKISEEPFTGLPEDRPVTVSIGVAGYDKEKHATPDDFIQMVDDALYKAKKQGKNQMVRGE
jgi:diguanylate cyclase (GGDEF)-like protein